MSLDSLTQDLHTSIKSGDKLRTGTLRFLIAAIKKIEIDSYPPGSDGSLTDEDVIKIIRRQVKTHDESITAFTKGNRVDLAEKETTERDILKNYLPKDLSDDGLRTLIRSIVGNGETHFGKVMGLVMKQVAGRAAGEKVAQLVKEELG